METWYCDSAVGQSRDYSIYRPAAATSTSSELIESQNETEKKKFNRSYTMLHGAGTNDKRLFAMSYKMCMFCCW